MKRGRNHLMMLGFLKYPAIIRMDEGWLRNVNQTQTGLPDGRWVPSRPLPFYGRWGRWRAAWLVFKGEADALVWPGQ